MDSTMSFSYQRLLSSISTQVSETQQSYSFLTERHVQVMWIEQKYFVNLYTFRGEKITVLSPGIWNTGAGPDFLKTHLRIGNKEWRGDVEIHLADESWYHHGHQQDERYNHVILHLSFWNPKHPNPLLKKNGSELITAYLEDYLTVPITRLTDLIDLDLYPYKKFSGSGQCAEKLFERLSEDQISIFFSSAAQWRLEQKKRYLQARFSSSALQLAGGIAMALGYKNNSEAFLELFHFLLSHRDLPTQVILAIGLGCCGFFENKSKQQWENSTFYQDLKRIWGGEKDQVIYQTCLRLDHIRPLNHPVRRIAYMIKLLADPCLEELWSQLLCIWSSFINKLNRKQKDILLLRQNLINLIPSYEDVYWNSHYTFENNPQKTFLSLIGEDLKTEILINTFFPLLYADIKDKGDLNQLEAFRSLYAIFNAPYTSKGRYLTYRFFGESFKTHLLKKAEMAQGAYQLHKDFCIHFEASCEGCPFVDRYTSRFGSLKI
jgi:hypothetical protein